ncbi:MAG: hypothetical protein HYR56_21315 [Acidobacteria bacterium]|nr:hypothetical protein [Acidobacteriota bacterium]MBI3423035.1 hypothetical protein [Acidobacteriota bacterium]
MPTERETEPALEALLAWLGTTPEQAGQRYELLRCKLMEFFERHACSPADEWADRTFDIVGRKLAGGETIHTDSPAAYCLGVARMLRKEYWRAPERKLSPLESAGAFTARDQHAVLAGELQFACMAVCLNKLPAADRQFIQNYYHDDWHAQVQLRRALAERLKLAPASIRARALRIRAQLAPCVEHCVARER